MLVVKVELLPFGREEHKKLLGIAMITNDGTGNVSVGNYNVTLSKSAPDEDKLWKKGKVTGFRRRRRGPWDLLYLALHNIVANRNEIEVGRTPKTHRRPTNTARRYSRRAKKGWETRRKNEETEIENLLLAAEQARKQRRKEQERKRRRVRKLHRGKKNRAQTK